ncbi:uncharacterized protein LOC143912805 [Arctopsyche grandis]|uniref:uncharacterized protein LOC143912805 n=1 Tax=Arctopsyche grandis TaxID=121162 RepID=UPI00406D67CC
MAFLSRHMWYNAILLIVLLSVRFTAQSVDTNEVDDEEPGDFMDLASTLLQGSLGNKNGGGGGLGALGGILGTLMQGDNGKNIGDMLVGMQNNKNNAAGDVISSLGALFTNKDGNLDPNVLGSVISAFAESAMANKHEGGKQHESKLKSKNTKSQQAESGLDMNTILNVASAFLGQQNQNQEHSNGNNAVDDIVGALPMLMNTFSAFNGPEADEREHKHSGHAAFLPPIVEKLHVYWDHFINSDLGKALWQNTGMSEMTKTFMDKEGNVNFEIVLKSLENHSFRRRWIKTASNYLTEWLIHVANPEVQQRYLTSGQFVVNGFLKSQGFPKHAMFQPTKFSESISNVVNYVLMKYLNTPTDVSVYVKPAVNYVKELMKSAQSHGSYLRRADQNELSDKITDTLNLEIIEPILRVYRAFRFARKAPHCQTHVLCVINTHDPNEKLGLPGFKAGLTKLSSFVASAVLSYEGGHGFWDLYTAIQDDSNCRAKYPAVCDEFHDEELKVTTEYYHNEL